MDDNEYFDMALHELDKRESRPSAPCWREDDDEDWDGNEYCHDCGQVLAGNIVYSRHYNESDHSCGCARCGTLLGYTLTDYGVRSELQHFLAPDTMAWHWNHQDDCFVIARILRGVVGGGHYDWDEIDPALRRDLLALLRKGRNAPAFTSEEAT